VKRKVENLYQFPLEFSIFCRQKFLGLRSKRFEKNLSLNLLFVGLMSGIFGPDFPDELARFGMQFAPAP